MATPLSAAQWVELELAQPELAAIPVSLKAHIGRVHADAGDTLCRIGERPKSMFFVVHGEIRLLRHSHNGEEIVLQRATGGFVAEASLESRKYHCDIAVARDSDLLCLPVERFRAALRDDEGFRQFWISRLASEVRKLRAQCERLTLRGAPARILHYVAAEGVDGRLELTQTRKAWAAELGMTHEALYRALAGMSSSNQLDVEERGQSVILTIPAGRKRSR